MACAASTSVGESPGVSNLDLKGTGAADGESGVCEDEVGVAARVVGVDDGREGAGRFAEGAPAARAVGIDDGRAGARLFAEGAPEGASGVEAPALFVSVFCRAPEEAVARTGASPSPLLSRPPPLPPLSPNLTPCLSRALTGRRRVDMLAMRRVDMLAMYLQ